MKQALVGVLGGAVMFVAVMAQAEEAAPCPTPCLALPPAKVETPPDKAPKQPPPAAKARQAPSPRSAPSPTPAAARPPLSRRCADIMMRAQVGEPVSDRDMAYLRNDC
ncbi:hypothetical protein [Xenophilus azovorans]|uniref:hypothetical protein n=1 Tax=Xenophilus azovorans TaxID=151755 RepID=UPI00056E703E|nr:hypothetical protein [Xenophilus azovorans]